MTLKTWSFSKKKNSTAQPSGSSRDYTVYMKENTSIERPVFIIGSGIDAGINYCQFSGNYYFIDDIEMLSKDQVALHCSIDVLATHKASIGAYTGFVERCSNASYIDTMIYDPAISQSQQIISESSEITNMFGSGIISSEGVYVLKVVGAYGSSTGGISMYVLSVDELKEVLDFMFSDSNFEDLFSDSVVKSFFNPFQYIVGLHWFPFSKSAFGTVSPRSVKFGWWETDGDTYGRLENLTINGGGNVTIPSRYYADFRSYHNGFTQMSLFLPTVGLVPLDPSLLSRSGGNLQVGITVDIATGNTLVNLWRVFTGGVQDLLASYKGKIGVDVPIGQSNGEFGSLATSAAMTVGGAFAGDAAAAIGGIQGIVGSYNPGASVIGNYGGRESVAYQGVAICSIRTYRSGELLTNIHGRPCCKNIQLGLAPGFIKCAGASISLAAPDTETEAVDNYLNSGFYYE